MNENSHCSWKGLASAKCV